MIAIDLGLVLNLYLGRLVLRGLVKLYLIFGGILVLPAALPTGRADMLSRAGRLNRRRNPLDRVDSGHRC